MPQYLIHNFGCRASAADGDAIASQVEAGLQQAQQHNPFKTQSEDSVGPAVVIVNTCAVTQQAERTARAFIRRTHREHPGARILVTGCYAQREPRFLQSMPGVVAVIGNSHKAQTASLALQTMGQQSVSAPTVSASTPPGFVPISALLHTPFSQLPYAAEHALPLTTDGRRTRPILKVQDGCSNRCSFCVIPETRGNSRSVPLVEALTATRKFSAGGGQELVLSGINLGRWGRDLGSLQLDDLVRALLEETSLPRLRISSVEPMDWSRNLLALYARYAVGPAPRLAPHAHLPLQSGADAVLRAMHRRYRPWHYAEKLQQIRALLPGAAIGADVMVGFPGETETLFQETLRFIEDQPLTYLHLFPFSPRPRTGAQLLHAQVPVPADQVQRRMHALAALSAAKHAAFARMFLGKTVSAITLRDGTALSANYLSVQLTNSEPPNRLLPVHLASIQAGSLLGAIQRPPFTPLQRFDAELRAGQ